MPRDFAVSTDLKRCPSCGSLVAEMLRVCDHCGHIIIGGRTRKQNVRITNVHIKNSVINRSSLNVADGNDDDTTITVEDSHIHNGKIAGKTIETKRSGESITGAAHMDGRGDPVASVRGHDTCPTCGKRITSRHGFCDSCAVQVVRN